MAAAGAAAAAGVAGVAGAAVAVGAAAGAAAEAATCIAQPAALVLVPSATRAPALVTLVQRRSTACGHCLPSSTPILGSKRPSAAASGAAPYTARRSRCGPHHGEPVAWSMNISMFSALEYARRYASACAGKLPTLAAIAATTQTFFMLFALPLFALVYSITLRII
ncbi:hypothetical protein D3C87_1600390 [compost metagenome]